MIPSTAHFIWFGTSLPWVHLLAMRSALDRGGFDRVVLHHEDDLSNSPWWGELEALEGFESRRLDAEALLGAAPGVGTALVDIYRTLTAPAARANMVRAAILAAEGGVYLDLDTVTVASFDELRARGGVFCGAERIVLPHTARAKICPVYWARVGTLLAVRDAFRRLPHGWRPFRLLEGLYSLAVNNAIVGVEPGHPFATDLLERMAAMPLSRQQVRYALGTHLLQQAVEDWHGADLKVCGPEVFYPLAPEVSGHWFAMTETIRLADVVLPETVSVHWYASVRTRDVVPQIDPAYVRAHAHEQLFSAIALPWAVA